MRREDSITRRGGLTSGLKERRSKAQSSVLWTAFLVSLFILAEQHFLYMVRRS